MPLARKETPLERRLRELEKETDSVRHNIRSLSKSVGKLGSVSSAATTAERIQRETHRTGRSMPADAAHARPPSGASPQSGAARTEETAAASVADPKKPPVRGDERFASYFSSGSFGKARPLSQERKLQRNKAIMMVLFVIIVAFILFRVMF